MDKGRLEETIGQSITDEQYNDAVKGATQKLQSIIQRFGDENGVRRTPDYLDELVIEAVTQKLFSDYTVLATMHLLGEKPSPIRTYCNMSDLKNQ